MEICVLGLNHRTAPLELRERLNIPFTRAPFFLDSLASRRVFSERVLLSTCNRTEIYGVSTDAETEVRAAKECLSDFASVKISDFESKLYVLRQPDSVRHLFSVASGLDSMVIGETEISGQVKDAYLDALKRHQTGKVLNTLFQKSLKVAKTVRTAAPIGAGRVSVASVAVELADKIFERLEGIRVMVIGTGDMAGQVLRAMASKGARPMVVSSHCYDRAQDLAEELKAEPVHFDFYEERVKDIDIIIGSTLCPRTLIQQEQVRRWMKLRRDRPLFLIDIAMPRNIDPSVEKLDNVYLYNLDDLHAVAAENLARRESFVTQSRELVSHQTSHFMDWLRKEFGGG